MDESNLYDIRKAGQDDIPSLAQIIRHAYKDVARRFSLTPQNCPKHPSNYTNQWVQGETKFFDHLPFEVTFLTYMLKDQEI